MGGAFFNIAASVLSKLLGSCRLIIVVPLMDFTGSFIVGPKLTTYFDQYASALFPESASTRPEPRPRPPDKTGVAGMLLLSFRQYMRSCTQPNPLAPSKQQTIRDAVRHSYGRSDS